MKNLKVGDIITARRSGIHKVVGFKPVSWTNVPYVSYKMIAREDGTPVKSRTVSSCPDYYCNLAMDYFKSEIDNYHAKIEGYHKALKFISQAENQKV